MGRLSSTQLGVCRTSFLNWDKAALLTSTTTVDLAGAPIQLGPMTSMCMSLTNRLSISESILSLLIGERPSLVAFRLECSSSPQRPRNGLATAALHGGDVRSSLSLRG